jgi:short-subunit dehydrogenase
MAHFQGKHIWIIGASSGIGEALSRCLASRGAILALSARKSEALNRLNRELNNAHLSLPLDVTDQNELIEARKFLEEQWGKIDSVILLSAMYEPMTFSTLDIPVVRHIIETNLLAAFYAVSATLPFLKQQGYGQLVLCGSIAGYSGLPNGQPYSATKAAIINLAESLRAETLDFPAIDIKLINPGFVKTPMTDKNSFSMPMIITPEEAAEAIASGLQSKAFEIHFPKRFTRIMKLLRHLPYWLYFCIMRRL